MLVPTGNMYVTRKVQARQSSVQTTAIMKESQRHKATRKPSDENKLFDPRGECSPAAVAAAFLGEFGDDVSREFAFLASLSFQFQLVQYGVIVSLQKLTLDILNNEWFVRTSLICHHTSTRTARRL